MYISVTARRTPLPFHITTTAAPLYWIESIHENPPRFSLCSVSPHRSLSEHCTHYTLSRHSSAHWIWRARAPRSAHASLAPLTWPSPSPPSPTARESRGSPPTEPAGEGNSDFSGRYWAVFWPFSLVGHLWVQQDASNMAIFRCLCSTFSNDIDILKRTLVGKPGPPKCIHVWLFTAPLWLKEISVWTTWQRRNAVQGGPYGLGTLFADIKLKVPLQNILLILKHNCYFNVNKRLSTTRLTTL